MNITLIDRFSSGENSGGDTIQIQAICQFLIKNNYNAKITKDFKEKVNKTDLAILFNLTSPMELFYHVDLLKKYNIPYIFFPVYWDIDKVIPTKSLMGLKGKIKKVIPNPLTNLLRGMKFYKVNKMELGTSLKQVLDWGFYRKKVCDVLKSSKYICVNSFAEKKHIIEKFHLTRDVSEKIIVIYNGIDKAYLHNIYSLKSNFAEKYISCVGGIGPRKNQINLVRAANALDINLYIVGKATNDNSDYYSYLKKISNTNIKLIGHLPYSETKVVIKESLGHIQPSYIETPGLASMEALALGVPIGISDVSPVREYFGENAYYLNPHDIKSIQEVLRQLWLSKHIDEPSLVLFREKYDWNNVLKPLLKLLH